jgi:hypothetical protein
LRRPIFAVSALALWTSAALAGPEQTPELNVELDAPDGCAIAEPIEREVERLLRPTVTKSKPPDLKLSVIQEGPERFRLIIETSDEAKGRFRRELESSSCRDFIRPTAVIIALAINPKALEGVDPPPESSPEADARPSETPFAPTAAPPATEVSNPGTGRAPEVERDALADDSSPAKRHRVAPFLRAAQVTQFGVLPAVGLGPALGGGLRWRWLRAEASGVYLPARRATLSTNPDRGGDIDLVAAALSVCAVPLRARAELGGCLGSDVGALAGEGFGVSNPTSGSATWLAAKAGILAGYAPHHAFAAMLHVDAIRRIGDAEFELKGLGPVHQPAAWGLRLDLGLELRFE